VPIPLPSGLFGLWASYPGQPARIARAWQRRILLLALGLTSGGGIAGAEPARELVGRPLAPRSIPAGSKMFTPVTSAASGLRAPNAYDDPRMWWELHQEFKFGAIGSGVAIGDYDNDGRPDVVVLGKTEGPRLFRNLGDWRFEEVTGPSGLSQAPSVWEQGVAWAKRLAGREATPTWHQGVTLADVNNDGWLDLYLCRFAAPNLLFINQRNGTFTEEAAARGLAIADASNMAAFGDYDRDGWLDVYLQTNLLDVAAQPTGQRDYLFRNNGDGTFTDVTESAGITGRTQGHSATWWDYDGDGWPDLYVANDFAPADSLYRNNGDGTFTDVIDRAVPQLPHSAMGADLGDVNNDGFMDLLVADMAATTPRKDQRSMARIRALLTDMPDQPGRAAQFMRNALLLGTGTPHVLEAAALAGLDATDWTWSVRLEDLDNDGWTDAFFTNGMVRELHNADLVQRTTAMDNVAEGVRSLKASPPLAEPNLAFRNRGDLQFENVSAAWGLDQVGVSFGAAFGDLDGDGDLDLVFTNYEREATVLRNDSASGHRLVIALRGTRSNRFGVGATVRIETDAGAQVRQSVLARGYLSSSEPVLHFGLGAHERVHRLTVQWPSGYTQVLTDIAANQHLTITEAASNRGVPSTDRTKHRDSTSLNAAEPAPTGRTSVLLEPPPPPLFTDVTASTGLALHVREPRADELAREPLLPIRQNPVGPALAVGDLDGDGDDDLVLGGTPLDPARILWREGPIHRATRLAPAAPLPAVNDGPVLIFDADGDGDQDVLVTRGGVASPAGESDYQPVLLLNDGQGRFSPAPPDSLPHLPISAGAAVAADFDRDGRLDLFIGGRVRPGQYPLPAMSALLRNIGGSRFEDVTDPLAPDLRHAGLVTSALWTDVDDDGWLDLVVASVWGGIRVWVNAQGRLIERSEQHGFTSAGTGWWNSLAAADFNRDGRLDYVAGNVGLNTTYHATPAQPVLLFHGEFASGRPPQLIEAHYDGDRLVPRQPRHRLGAQIPTILRRYPRNDPYAEATLPDLLGRERLDAARKFAATELRSGVFLSQPDGTHRFAPLPRLAQLAPAFGLATGDFDGDGHADLYVAQNSHAPIGAIGRFTGGLSLLLRGNGRGEFTPVPPAESGLVVPGDAKAVVTLDLDGDGWPDVMVTRNDASTLAFRHNGFAARHSFAIRLRGPVGNGAAIGARITVELANGSTQTSEVHSGAGYMSQSAALFFGYSSAQPPRRVHIRWPSGTQTEHALTRPPTGTLVLTAPPR
jgi:enediyne biosynthesis protein E4